MYNAISKQKLLNHVRGWASFRYISLAEWRFDDLAEVAKYLSYVICSFCWSCSYAERVISTQKVQPIIIVLAIQFLSLTFFYETIAVIIIHNVADIMSLSFAVVL